MATFASNGRFLDVPKSIANLKVLTPYGLSCVIWTENPERARRMAAQMDVPAPFTCDGSLGGSNGMVNFLTSPFVNLGDDLTVDGVHIVKGLSAL